MVKRVKRLPAQLSRQPLRKLDVFEQGEIRSPEARSAQRTRAAVGHRGLRSIGWRVSAGVEPVAESFGSAGIGIADLIRTATHRRSAEQTAGPGWVHATQTS